MRLCKVGVYRAVRSSNAQPPSGYGMTEIPSANFLPPSDAERKCGSIGKLYSNLEARLVAGDIDAEEGQPGELWIRGPMVMKVIVILLSGSLPSL